MTIGGGSIFSNFSYGRTWHEVATPAPREWGVLKRQGVDELEGGKTAVGGYYNIKNIQWKDPNAANKFIDIQILTADFKDDADLKGQFDGWNTTQPGGTICCWEDSAAGRGIKEKFTGFVRMMTYTKVGGQPTDALETYDGLLKKGSRHGFGRYVNGEARTSFVGRLEGSTVPRNGKGLFWKDFDAKAIGVWSSEAG